jgi:hypothetical protein
MYGGGRQFWVSGNGRLLGLATEFREVLHHDRSLLLLGSVREHKDLDGRAL